MRLPRWLTRALLRRAERVISSRPPDMVIGSGGAPYMNRWWLFRSVKWLPALYLHEFLHDDDDRALHDHPWFSCSFMLKGMVLEIYAPHGSDPRDKRRHARRIHKAGDVIWRSARFSHRIELIGNRSLTLFFVSPNVRRWGFWCPAGWRHWKQYVSADDSGKIGGGCG